MSFIIMNKNKMFSSFGPNARRALVTRAQLYVYLRRAPPSRHSSVMAQDQQVYAQVSSHEDYNYENDAQVTYINYLI